MFNLDSQDRFGLKLPHIAQRLHGNRAKCESNVVDSQIRFSLSQPHKGVFITQLSSFTIKKLQYFRERAS